nr:hypothetical protein Q903MT_gene2257 [Picea sitchensis]
MLATESIYLFKKASYQPQWGIPLTRGFALGKTHLRRVFGSTRLILLTLKLHEIERLPRGGNSIARWRSAASETPKPTLPPLINK